MSTRKSVCVIFALLVLPIGIFALPPSATTSFSANAAPQVGSLWGPPDPPTTRLIREYILPVVPITTIAYLGPSRAPFGIAYDPTGQTWVTDINRDAIYQLTPASTINQSSTTALEWILPNTAGKRSPLYIIADDSKKVVWFTDPTSYQISRLNWSNGQLDDWDLANLNVMPLDLVMQSSNVIWFTGVNDNRFFQLQVNTNTVFSYLIMSATGGPAAKPTRLTINASCLFFTDSAFDRLYEVPLPAVANALIYPLTHPGFSWDVDVDTNKNAWVTQPLSSLIDEQLAHSVNKSYYNIISPYQQFGVSPESQILNPNALTISIQITPVTPSVFHGPLNVTGDPYAVWSIPTGVTAVTYVPPPARPWDVDTSADGYAWFTEPIHNHVGVIQNDTAGTILLYSVPTAESVPLSMDIQPGNPSSSYHVWFTEYHAGKIGELFNATHILDLRVCPSLPAQYPPPPPGSIRWTQSEIWNDAPSNGYNAAHHDSPEIGVANVLHTIVTNLGAIDPGTVFVSFYWYSNTSYSLDLNFIPLPPSAISPSWTLIGVRTLSFITPGSSEDCQVGWYPSANMPTNITIAVRVTLGVGSDDNVYDNIAYANFTLTTPSTPPAFTVPGVAVGFVVGFGVMAGIAVLARKK